MEKRIYSIKKEKSGSKNQINPLLQNALKNLDTAYKKIFNRQKQVGESRKKFKSKRIEV